MVRSAQSLRMRQNAAQHPRKERRENHKKSIPLQSKKIEYDTGGLMYPGGETAFKALLSARICAAFWSHITDCDETYNYWEPMHFLVFNKGLQTWEYSPQFALRSYTYLLLHALPAYIYHKLLQPNPLYIFYFTRILLGVACTFVEVYFYKAVCREFGVHIGRICLAFQLFSAGMFIASTAFLPSTFAMYTLTAACAAWWQQKYPLAIFLSALGSILGWPFAALLGVPIVFDMLFMRKLHRCFLQWSAISGVVVLVPMVLIDSMHYGRLVIAPFNIVKYNVLGGAGPNLYGTEPWHFYFINGFLNFNIIWILALFCPLALVLSYFFIPARNKSTLTLPHILSLSPMYLWLLVFLLQPHKEERFLFPIYPMICLCGAVAVDIIQKLFFRAWSMIVNIPAGIHYLDRTVFIMITAIVVGAVLGVSRTFSLYKNYHAPLDLMMELNRFPTEGKLSSNLFVNVCWGKDWHRYPSSFFLPNPNWNVRFIRSEFKGLLPFPFTGGENATTIVHSHFNDKNKENASVYIDVNKCHFLLDFDSDKETDLEPVYGRQRDKWKTVKSLPFLNAEKSNSLFRAFYIPFLSDRFVIYGNFSLLQSLKFTKTKS